MSTINKKGFCLLAGIPDLWMRKTTRATELLVNLNTQYCLSGETTRARFCSFMGMTDIIPAMRAFEVLGIFNVRATNRMSSTLKYLKSNGLILTNRFEGAKSPARLV